MATESNTTIEFRVLLGSQAGSRLALVVGQKYLIGKSTECEIILSGINIADIHASLSFRQGKPYLTSIDGIISDANGRLHNGDNEITLGTPFDLGGTWISIDYENSRWPEQNTIQNNAAPDKALGTVESITTPTTKPRIETATRQFISLPYKKMILALTCLMVVIGSFGAIWILGQKPQKSTTAMITNAQNSKISNVIKNIITSLDLRNTVKVEQNENGKYVISGYVPDARSKRLLMTRLYAINPQPEIKLIIEEEMLQDANALLKQHSIQNEQLIRAVYDGNGRLRLTGAASSIDLINATKKMLLSKVPGVRQVDSDVVLPERLRIILKEMISAAGLNGRLTFLRETPDVVLKGDLTNEEISKWEAMFLEFCNAYGNVLHVNANVGGQIRTVALNVQSIVNGAAPYIVTTHGERVNLGGVINGRTIISISDDNVIFDGNDQLKKAP